MGPTASSVGEIIVWCAEDSALASSSPVERAKRAARPFDHEVRMHRRLSAENVLDWYSFRDQYFLHIFSRLALLRELQQHQLPRTRCIKSTIH